MRRRREVEKKFERERVINKLAVAGVHELVVVLDHLKTGFNIGKIFRSAEVFGCREVHVIGTKFFDPFPSKGAFKTVPAVFFDSFAESYSRLKTEGYQILALDASGAETIDSSRFFKKTAFVIGHEEYGIQSVTNDMTDIKRVKIRQYGLTRSLNVSIAASIAMYEYCRSIGCDPV